LIPCASTSEVPGDVAKVEMAVKVDSRCDRGVTHRL
jgi:hypothetical protein